MRPSNRLAHVDALEPSKQRDCPFAGIVFARGLCADQMIIHKLKSIVDG